MSRSFKTSYFRTTALTTVLAAALASTSLLASAQNAPAADLPARQAGQTDARTTGHGERHARMAERHQQRLDQLKTRLQLTPQQESAWLAYVARTGPQTHGQPAAQRGERPDLASMTTPQRIEHMKAWQADRQARQQQRMEATLSFYQALTPNQQQVFDQFTLPGFMRTGAKAHGHGHRHHGPDGKERPLAPKS